MRAILWLAETDMENISFSLRSRSGIFNRWFIDNYGPIIAKRTTFSLVKRVKKNLLRAIFKIDSNGKRKDDTLNFQIISL